MKIGTIASIWRYPVKGMAGERLQSCELDSEGLKGDRVWAVQDVQRKEIQSCKFRPQLLQCRARCLDDNLIGQVEITFPNGQVLQCENSFASAQVDSLIGSDKKLAHLRHFDDDDL